MFFNSIDFILFLPPVFFLYWFVVHKNLSLQNAFIVLASYVFYGWWDWRFLFLILFSTVVDYLVGRGLSKNVNQARRKMLLCISIVINLSFLGFFKYVNFFVENFAAAFTFFGMKFNIARLNIILPVGISFYTFQTMSYSIDVYRKKIEPVKDFAAFAAFVSFFPQLVAGPIERAAWLLPQFYRKREFSYYGAVDGCRQILWGFFKKIVIADSCAKYADMVFGGFDRYSGIVPVLGVMFFAVQIYGDFSGYSDIATGVSKLFGFTLTQNFAFPYFSRDIAEFWRRWHISLTTWFRDYVYIPLGGSRKGTVISLRNTLIIFLLSGFWHGAKWTFILWGLINALYFLPLLLTKNNRKNMDIAAYGRFLPSIKELFSITATFFLISFAWIFFRSETVPDSFRFIKRIFTAPFFSVSALPADKWMVFRTAIIMLFMAIEWLGRKNRYAIETLRVNRPLRWLFYYGITACVLLFCETAQTFIYFQF